MAEGGVSFPHGREVDEGSLSRKGHQSLGARAPYGDGEGGAIGRLLFSTQKQRQSPELGIQDGGGMASEDGGSSSASAGGKPSEAGPISKADWFDGDCAAVVVAGEEGNLICQLAKQQSQGIASFAKHKMHCKGPASWRVLLAYRGRRFACKRISRPGGCGIDRVTPAWTVASRRRREDGG